jgi:hypothetical protein
MEAIMDFEVYYDNGHWKVAVTESSGRTDYYTLSATTSEEAYREAVELCSPEWE